jgi:hypothetical protein
MGSRGCHRCSSGSSPDRARPALNRASLTQNITAFIIDRGPISLQVFRALCTRDPYNSQRTFSAAAPIIPTAPFPDFSTSPRVLQPCLGPKSYTHPRKIFSYVTTIVFYLLTASKSTWTCRQCGRETRSSVSRKIDTCHQTVSGLRGLEDHCAYLVLSRYALSVLWIWHRLCVKTNGDIIESITMLLGDTRKRTFTFSVKAHGINGHNVHMRYDQLASSWYIVAVAQERRPQAVFTADEYNGQWC